MGRRYEKKEKLEGDNAIYIEKTKQKENATRQLLFWNLPKILICTLKRFSNNSRKNQKYVDFNLDDLDLSDYVLGYDNNSYKYELYGICNHQGSCLGGHYTAFVKNANGKWYFFNDTNVMEVKDNNKLKTINKFHNQSRPNCKKSINVIKKHKTSLEINTVFLHTFFYTYIFYTYIFLILIFVQLLKIFLQKHLK